MDLHEEHLILARIECSDEVAGIGRIEFCALPPEDMVEMEGSRLLNRVILPVEEYLPQCHDHIVFEFTSGGLQHLPRLLAHCPSCIIEGAPESWMEGMEQRSRRDSVVKYRSAAYRAFIRSSEYGGWEFGFWICVESIFIIIVIGVDI